MGGGVFTPSYKWVLKLAMGHYACEDVIPGSSILPVKVFSLLFMCQISTWLKIATIGHSFQLLVLNIDNTWAHRDMDFSSSVQRDIARVSVANE